MSEQPIITVENLSFTLEGREILHDISFTVGAHEIVTIIGPNGSGKTTLVRVILGLLKGQQGVVKVNGKRIGYMPQRFHIEPTLPLTVENFLALCQRDKTGHWQKWVALLGISHLLPLSMHHLSGGEMQRTLLVCALLNEPDLLILDEPGQGVDVLGQIELYQLLMDVRRDLKCSILLISHDLHLVMGATDRVICLNKHICCEGVPETVQKHPAYLKLFGTQGADALAIYTHQHDHRHDVMHKSCEDSHG